MTFGQLCYCQLNLLQEIVCIELLEVARNSSGILSPSENFQRKVLETKQNFLSNRIYLHKIGYSICKIVKLAQICLSKDPASCTSEITAYSMDRIMCEDFSNLLCQKLIQIKMFCSLMQDGKQKILLLSIFYNLGPSHALLQKKKK